MWMRSATPLCSMRRAYPFDRLPRAPVIGPTATTIAADGRAGSRHVRPATAAQPGGKTLMWMLIFIVFGLLFAGAVSGGMLTLILIPLFLVAVVAVAAIGWLRRQVGDDAPTVVSSQPQPTGRPRTASG